MPNVKESLFGPRQLGQRSIPLSHAAVSGMFAGLTTINSGSSSVTVSTAVVTSGSLIMYGTNPSSIGPNSGGGIAVSSVVDGVSFAFARPTGNAVAWDETVMWEIVRTS